MFSISSKCLITIDIIVVISYTMNLPYLANLPFILANVELGHLPTKLYFRSSPHIIDFSFLFRKYFSHMKSLHKIIHAQINFKNSPKYFETCLFISIYWKRKWQVCEMERAQARKGSLVRMETTAYAGDSYSQLRWAQFF